MTINFISKLSALFRSGLGQALMRTFVARVVSALGAFLLLLIIGRLYGAAGAGVYALAYSMLMGAGMLARTGMDNALMRYVGQNPLSPEIGRYLGWAFSRALLIAVIISTLLFFGRNLAGEFFGSLALPNVLLGMVFSLPAYVSGLLMAGFYKGVGMPVTATLLENGAISLLAGFFIIAIYYGVGFGGLPVIGWAYAAGAWLVAFAGAVRLYVWVKGQSWFGKDLSGPFEVTRKQFQVTSNAFFATHLAAFLYSVVGVLIAGWFLKDSQLGLVKAAQQTAVLIGFVLIVINTIFPPRFASLHHRGDKAGLARLSRQGALLGLLLSSPLLLLCLLFPGRVLALFGADFVDGGLLLQVMALAQLVNVSTGSVGLLLNMTGLERLMRNIALVCSASGLIFFFTLIPLYGPLGAVLALSFVLVIQNLVALYFVWKRLGIWTLPLPNFLRMMGVRPD